MVSGLTLICPVRGRLKAKAKGADGLTPTEERFRVEAIKHLVDHGYPAANFVVEAVIKRFGNAGRNSFRADFIVLDVPANTIAHDDIDALLSHALVLAEVKRDNADAKKAKDYQVNPMLDFAARDDCVALYWDDIEQRVFWIIRTSGAKRTHEGPLADLPAFGHKPGATALTFATIDPDKPLLGVFKRIEDVLHAASLSPSKRFTVMLQLLLAKLYDEHQHEASPTAPLALQDYRASEVDAANAASQFNAVLKNAVKYYQTFLPEQVSDKLGISGQILLEVMRILAPIKIVSMKQNVIQDFYMYFAKHIYKWDLAQYFTPTTLTDFIIEVLNPGFAEHVKDPACGSADFLTAAFRRGQGQRWPDYASSIWGSDVSTEAVQVAVLNMILNGDGKTNITHEDSLVKIQANLESCDVVVCNPPFGTRIVEPNASTLANFDLGHEWVLDETGAWVQTGRLLANQETGILFAEACVKLLRPDGRLALIVPNGYLGNRSAKYLLLREWLLRQVRIAAIVALPRFTFKSSGADVSASVLFCEKRQAPLATAADTDEYEACVQVIDRVGWITGNKRAEPVFRRDAEDGTMIHDAEGEPILDSDFADALASIRASDASQQFAWITRDVAVDENQEPGWVISSSAVTTDPYLTLDAKRHCEKFAKVRSEIMAKPHIVLGDVVDFLAEKTTSKGKSVRVASSRVYRHVEIQDVETGTYRWHARRGWELPARAKHVAEIGDIYVGAIWGSARKWFLAGADADGLVVTNGMHRMRIKDGREALLLDLVVGLCSEAYAVQMRGFARGSDGLAEIAAEDAALVVLPRITKKKLREEIQPFVDQLLAGFTSVEAKISALVSANRLPLPPTPARPDHTSVV